MSDTPTNVPADRQRRRRRGLAFAAAGLAVAAVAVPATATVLIQNFAKADISKSAACLTKVAGTDATTYATAANAPYIGFNGTGTAAVTGSGVNLLNETLSVKAFQGDRLIVTDGMRISNTCNYPLTVSMKAEPSASGAPALSGDWTDITAKLYLANPSGAAGTDFALAADWDQAPISVNAAGTTAAGTLSNAATGTITLPAAGSVKVGVAIDAGMSAVTATNSVINFTITAAG